MADGAAGDGIVAALSLEFADELRTPEIEVTISELERRVRDLYPAVIALFIKPQSSIGYNDMIARRYGNLDR